MLSNTELFNLGCAYSALGYEDVDGAVHCILPCIDLATNERENDNFKELCATIELVRSDLECNEDEAYFVRELIRKFAIVHGIKF